MRYAMKRRQQNPQQQQQQQQKNKRKVSRPLLIWIILLQCLILTWACILSWIISQFTPKQLTESTQTNIRGASTSTTDTLAYQENRAEVPGIELQIPSSVPNQDAIQVVYAPTASHANGLVLLLHACTHSALKFFSLSSTCPDCVGLSEELRIVRLLLEKGYTPVAISCINRKSGCWTNPDQDRIVKVLQHQLFANHTVYAMGASSGGSFAAQLLVRGVVDGALVMVMSLGNDVVGKLRRNPKPLYLAPMPRDKRTTTATINNYQDLKELNTEHKQMIILDTKSCDSLPITRSYLQERVPGMTANIADRLISSLLQEKHLDASQMLIVDPTKSNWREIVSPDNSTRWLNKFVLKPGYSPLAKALHRAWAYHEYCSEVVVPALELFESNSQT